VSHNPWASDVRDQFTASEAPISVQENMGEGYLRFFVRGQPSLGESTHETEKIRVRPSHAEAAGSPEHRVQREGTPSGPQLAVLGLLFLVLLGVTVH
jgi:hypothetical protein